MTEIESLVCSNPDNLELLNQLRMTVSAELAGSPFERPDLPAATVERAVYTFLDDARLWRGSPRLVSLVTELETLSRSFAPSGRVRGLQRLSPEAMAALLDEAPGGPALARPVMLVDGAVADIGEPDAAVALLTARPSEDARLLGRLAADRPIANAVYGVATTILPMADRVWLRKLFAEPDSPGRGDLGALKQHLNEADRLRVANVAARTAINLKLAFRMRDKRRDHQRGSTAATYLSPAPLARLAITIVDLVLPRDAPFLFLGERPGLGHRDRAGPSLADHVRFLFAEILETAREIVVGTDALNDKELFSGLSVPRRVSDLSTQVRKLRKRGELGVGDFAEAGFDGGTTVARRLIEKVIAARDVVLLLRAYEATFLAYTDAVMEADPADALRTACDTVVRDVCGSLQRRYRLARADLDDGVFYETDVQHRATGSAKRRPWLTPSVAAAPVVFSKTLFVPILARPTQLRVLDDIVEDIAAEIESSTEYPNGRSPATDTTSLRASSLRRDWAALKAAYPPENFLHKQ